jgi:lipoyl-dependent peroxiredoxin
MTGSNMWTDGNALADPLHDIFHPDVISAVGGCGNCGRTGLASGHSGALSDLPITLASRFGEPEGKTSPEELIAAAHAGCFTMTLGSILAREGTPPEHLQVTATVTLETSGTPTIASSQLEVHGVVPERTR